MSQAISKFVADVALHFPNRFDTEASEDEWLQSMSRNLRGYSADVLKYAAQKIIDTRTDRRFPLPSECKKICNEIAQREAAEKPQLGVDKKLPPLHSDSRVKWADTLIDCPIGREAARDGWVLSLHDFARVNGKLPVGSEIAACKAGAKGFDEAFTLCARGEAGPLNKPLLGLGQAMLARRRELEVRLLGRAA